MEFNWWFSRWDKTGDPEIRRLCEITWRVARDEFTALDRIEVKGEHNERADSRNSTEVEG